MITCSQAFLKACCDWQVKIFLDVFNDIKFLVALKKTVWGTMLRTFLDLLLDTERQMICIPVDKIEKALNWVEFFLNKANKKATVLQFQKLCGTLNFLCQCIVQGEHF